METPNWVKAFAVIGVILVLMLVVALLSGANHTPGRHMGAAGTATSRA